MSHLGLHAYKISQEISAIDPPFYALIASAMRKADGLNARLLQAAWPEIWDELQKRYNAPGGRLVDEL